MSLSKSLLSKEQELALQIADLQSLLQKEREKNKNYESQVSWLTLVKKPQSSFLSEDQNMALRIAELEALLLKKDEKLKNYESQVSWLTEQLKTLKRNQFGSKSERWESKEQLKFNEAEVEARSPIPEKDDYVIEVKGHTKKVRGHRKPLPENLPREIIKIELATEEHVTEQGEKLKVIGWEISEKLKYEPSQISVIEYHRAKYGVDSGDYIKTAPPVPSVIPKGIATPELLAAIVVGKYADGLPLYRLEEIFERQGVELGRTTMSDGASGFSSNAHPQCFIRSNVFRSCYFLR